MNNTINLLDYRSKVSPSANSKHQKLLRRIALGLLFMVSASSVIIFILVALSPIPQLERQRKAALSQLALVNNNIVKILLVQERAKSVNQILGERNTYDKVLEDFQSTIPSGVSIKTLKLNENELSVVISSKSLRDIDSFLKDLTEDKSITKPYSNVVLSGISTDPNSSTFTASLKITL